VALIRRLLQHVTWQNVFIVGDKVDLEGLDWACHKFGNLYFEQGKLAEAEAMYKLDYATLFLLPISNHLPDTQRWT